MRISVGGASVAAADEEDDVIAEALVVAGARLATCEDGAVHDASDEAIVKLVVVTRTSARATLDSEPGANGIPSGYFFGGGVSRSSAR
jgi:hypothetical protein